jgi:hypothetical protein
MWMHSRDKAPVNDESDNSRRTRIAIQRRSLRASADSVSPYRLFVGAALLTLWLYEAIPAAGQSIRQQVPPRRSTQLSDGFGMNLSLPRDPRLPWTKPWWTRVPDSGVKWIRLGQYENSSEKTSWDWVEQTSGIYTVRPEVDEAIRSLVDNGVSIELQLCYGNALYEGDPATRPKRIEPAPPGVGDQDNPAPAIFHGLKTEDEIQGFLNYTRFMVNRYKDKIKYWEFWNESSIGYWQPNVESREERAAKGREYGRALCRVADVVHQTDPQSKVIFGGTSEIDSAFALAAISECPSKIDVMAYHTYPGYGRNEPPEEEDMLEGADLFREAVLRMPGVHKDIQIWENEWNTIPSWKNSSESVQAKYVPRFFLQALSQGVKPFFWEFIPGTDGNEGDESGLLHGETSDKNSFSTTRGIPFLRGYVRALWTGRGRSHGGHSSRSARAIQSRPSEGVRLSRPTIGKTYLRVLAGYSFRSIRQFRSY